MTQWGQIILVELPVDVAAVHANRDLRKYEHVWLGQVTDPLFDMDGNFTAECF